MENKFYVSRFREVELPKRVKSTDAGCDCYVPRVDSQFLEDLYKLNVKNKTPFYINLHCVINDVNYVQTIELQEIADFRRTYVDVESTIDEMLTTDIISQLYENGYDMHSIDDAEMSFYYTFRLPAHSRVLIPGGIKVTLFPKNSCLIACNKSGVATKTGLTYTCHVIDSFYTGEVCYGVANNSNEDVVIEPGKRLLQVLHIPVFLSIPIEISLEEYSAMTENSDRGEGGFGSTGLN